jgi:hypothetical protein
MEKSTYIDETGNRYGRLIVISKAETLKKGNKTLAQWNCICDCGQERIALGHVLRSGKLLSCGCLKRERAVENCQKGTDGRKGLPAYNSVDEIGNIYGRLTVIAQLPTKHKRSRWRCKCECGKEKNVTGGSLRSGKVQSCGCLYRDVDAFEKRKPRIVDYRRNARQRDYEFLISEEEFEAITSLSCHYCGEIAPNGIDRIDNKVGYVKENLVPCCSLCNRMKLTLTTERFIEQCNKIINHKNNITLGT